VGVGLGLCTRN